ncbi:hypothetical protein BH24ACT3_BH24ACT3_09720 [soil metagenome]
MKKTGIERQGAGQILVGLLLFVMVVGCGFFVARVAFRSFASLDSQVAAALAVAGATVIVVPITRWFERRRLREEPLQSRKVDVYERFIRGFLDNFFDQRRAGVIDEAKLLAFMTDITPDLTIWASDEVLAGWSRLRRRWADRATAGGIQALLELEQLFLSIRQDLGHSNKGLKQGDVLGLWVNDLGGEADAAGRES